MTYLMFTISINYFFRMSKKLISFLKSTSFYDLYTIQFVIICKIFVLLIIV